MVSVTVQNEIKKYPMFKMYQLPKTCNHIKTKRKQNNKIKTSVIFR